MKIEKADITDANNISTLAVQVWLDTYALDGIRDSFSEYVWQELSPYKFKARLENKNREIYKVVENEHLIGFVEINFDSVIDGNTNSKFEIEKLYIQENFCGKNIGGKLIDFVKSICIKNNISSMWLSVYENNFRAIKFYKKYGFKEIGELYFELKSERHRNIVLEKKLLNVSM